MIEPFQHRHDTRKQTIDRICLFSSQPAELALLSQDGILEVEEKRNTMSRQTEVVKYGGDREIYKWNEHKKLEWLGCLYLSFFLLLFFV